jgi:hypothetical protein
MYEGKRKGKSRVARGAGAGRATGAGTRAAPLEPPAAAARRGTPPDETVGKVPVVAAAAAPTAGLATDYVSDAARAAESPPAQVPAEPEPQPELGTVPRGRTRGPMAVKQRPAGSGDGEPAPAPSTAPQRRFRADASDDEEPTTRTLDRPRPEDSRKPPLDAIPPRQRKSR